MEGRFNACFDEASGQAATPLLSPCYTPLRISCRTLHAPLPCPASLPALCSPTGISAIRALHTSIWYCCPVSHSSLALPPSYPPTVNSLTLPPLTPSSCCHMPITAFLTAMMHPSSALPPLPHPSLSHPLLPPPINPARHSVEHLPAVLPPVAPRCNELPLTHREKVAQHN